MAGKPLTTDAIALTEKKMDMTLDDIIKMSKNNPSKTKKQRRVPNKSKNFTNNLNQDKSTRLRNFMYSRSSLRQGALAIRRSSFHVNQFSVTAEVARKAAAAPLYNRSSNRSRFSSWNSSRTGIPPSQRRPATGAFSKEQSLPASKQQVLRDKPAVSKQRPQTLDSLFADMKERRMRVLSRQNNSVQKNGAVSRRPPWTRDRFGN